MAIIIPLSSVSVHNFFFQQKSGTNTFWPVNWCEWLDWYFATSCMLHVTLPNSYISLITTTSRSIWQSWSGTFFSIPTDEYGFLNYSVLKFSKEGCHDTIKQEFLCFYISFLIVLETLINFLRMVVEVYIEAIPYYSN